MTEVNNRTTGPLQTPTPPPPVPPPPPAPVPASPPPGAPPQGDRRIATPGAVPGPDRRDAAIAGAIASPTGDLTAAMRAREARERGEQPPVAPSPAAAPPPAPPAAVPPQPMQPQDAARWLREQTASFAAIHRPASNNVQVADLARVSGLLQRPEQLQRARAAVESMPPSGERDLAMADVQQLESAVTGARRDDTQRRVRGHLGTADQRRNQSLAGVHSADARHDLQAVADGDQASKAAFARLADRPAQPGEFDAGRLATNPGAILNRFQTMPANTPEQRDARDAMVRQAVQGLADRSFGPRSAGGNGNVPDANRALDAGIQGLRQAGLDGAALDRAVQAVRSDPANQAMFQRPGLNAAERLLDRTGIPAAVQSQVDGVLDQMVGPRVEGQPSDNLGALSAITDRIPPGGARRVTFEGEGRVGPMQLGAEASMTIARTQPPAPPAPQNTRLQVTFSVAAHAAAGFERDFARQTGVGGVTGQVEAQARVDGRASFTYEFDTGNPAHMAQLRDMSGAVMRAVPGVGNLIGGTEGPGVQEAFRGLSERHTQTRLEASATATVRLEATAATSDRSQALVNRLEQARAGVTQIQALTGSMQTARTALAETPPNFSGAFGALESHLPAGAVRAGQVTRDAAEAQRLFAAGDRQGAMAIATRYLPQGLQNAAAVATDASRAYAAMGSGNVQEAFNIMRSHLPPSVQNAGQFTQDAAEAQRLYSEGKPEEAMQLLRGHLPQGLQNVSQVALDGFRAQQLLSSGNAAGAFSLMEQHLPPGAQALNQFRQHAEQAQALITAGNTTGAVALLTPYMPAGVQGTLGQAQAGIEAVNNVRAAFESGDLAAGLAAMQGAVTAGQGLAGALRQQVADLPGQIASARAAIQSARELPAQLRSQIAGLPAQAQAQVQGLLTQAQEQVQGLRNQAQDLRARAAALPATARVQAQEMRAQAQDLATRAQTQAQSLLTQARALPETVRQGVVDRISAATAAPTGPAGPIGSVQLTGSVSARYGHTTNYADRTTTTTVGLSMEGTAAAESSRIGQVGTSGARSADVDIVRGPDGRIAGVSITRTFEGRRFADTAGRELVGELEPQVIAGVEASSRVSVVQQVNMDALGITPDMSSAQVATRLATLALRADPPPGTGRVTRIYTENTETVRARVDFVAGGVGVRLDRSQQRDLLRRPGT